MNIPLCALIVEDSENDALLIAQALRRGGYDLTFERVETPEGMRDALVRRAWDIVIADYSMPRFSGLAALSIFKESGSDRPFILVSGTIGEDVAVEAMKAGAHDYVMKDSLARLIPAVQRELDEAYVRQARRQAEAALLESEARNRALLSAIPDLIFQLDKDGVHIDAVPSKGRGWASSAAEVIGKSVFDSLPPEVAQQRLDGIARALRTGEVQVQEYQLVENGKTVAYEARIVTCGGDQVLVIVRDVTERARAEEALRQRNRELATLYEIGRDISATLDLPQVLERIATHAQDLLGADAAQVYLLEPDGQTLRAIIALDKKSKLVETQIELKEGGAALATEGGETVSEMDESRLSLDVEEEGGIIGWVMRERQPLLVNDLQTDPVPVKPKHVSQGVRAWLGAPLVVRDRLIGALSAQSFTPNVFDNGHRRLLESLASQVSIALENARLFAEEEQRAVLLARSLEQQKELDYLKNQFIQNVSHELRTPLGLIQGYAELLDLGQLGDLQPDQQEPVAVIARRARMLGKLVDNLTAILETEKPEPERKLVNLAELVGGLLADFQTVADRQELTLVIEVAPDLPVVLGDSTQLLRVLDNLLGNAFKFTPSGGQIVVRLDEEEGCLILEVADTGVGIPTDQLDRIFERFYQVDGSMSRRYGGAGLGLALVKEIVETHGGSVNVESSIGAGSTFRVRLPVLST